MNTAARVKTAILDVNTRHSIQVGNVVYKTLMNAGFDERQINYDFVYRKVEIDAHRYIDQLVSDGYNVINASISNRLTLGNAPIETDPAVENAFMAGSTVIIANGNESSAVPMLVDEFSANPFAISVSSINSGGNEIASYALAHPGITNFVASGDAYFTGNKGTSFSAPVVAAATILIKDKFSEISESSLRSALENCSTGVTLSNNVLGQMVDDVYQVIDINRILELTSEDISHVNRKMMIDAAYEIVLNRNSDSQGLEWYLNSDMDIGEVVRSLQLAPEQPMNYDRVPLMEKVQAMYHLFLEREADDAGAAYWVNQALEQPKITGTELIDFHPVVDKFLAAADVSPDWW